MVPRAVAWAAVIGILVASCVLLASNRIDNTSTRVDVVTKGKLNLCGHVLAIRWQIISHLTCTGVIWSASLTARSHDNAQLLELARKVLTSSAAGRRQHSATHQAAGAAARCKRSAAGATTGRSPGHSRVAALPTATASSETAIRSGAAGGALPCCTGARWPAAALWQA